ncbi:MAG: hypothetical protein ACOYZ6_12390 [Chloroflexota bacterium]
MKNYSPSKVFGFFACALSAFIGSAIFSIIVLAYFTLKAHLTGNNSSGNVLTLDSIIIAPILLTLYVCWFSVAPGAFGGTLLAVWLRRGQRSGKSMTRMGLLIGALGGFVADILGFGFDPHWNRDWSTIPYALLVLFIAAPLGAITTHWLGSPKQANLSDQII